MRRFRLIAGMIGVALVFAGHTARAAQYEDINGLTGSLTGTQSFGGTIGLVDTTVYNIPVQSSTFSLPNAITFGAADSSDDLLTGSLNLPSLTVFGQTIQLPALPVSLGSFNRNTGAFDLDAGLTGANYNLPISFGITTGVSATIDLSIANPAIDLIGQADPASASTNTLVINSTQSSTIDIDASGDISVFGLSIPIVEADLQWTINDWQLDIPNTPGGPPPPPPSSPEPSAIVLAMSGGLASVTALRRRRS